MTKHMMMILVLFILALGGSGCASQSGSDFVSDAFRRGAQLEQQGQYFRAAEAYLVILGSQPRNQKARADLSRIIDQAITEKLSSAAALEAELRLDEAVAELDAARRLLQRSASFDVESGQASLVESRRSQLVDRRVQALLVEAARAREDGLWSAALANLQRVETLSPGYGQTRERMREVWVDWADANESEGRLRAAAMRLEEAPRVPGERSSAISARAAAIRSALGMSDLRNGACRAAVAELRAAEQLVPGSTEPGALQQAVACARTCVQLSITADPGSGFSDNPRGLLSVEVGRQITSSASEFLFLQEVGAATRPSCDARLVPGVDGQPITVGPYSISVRITAISIIRQPARSTTRQTRSMHGVHAETVVNYQEYTEAISGSLSGWVTVTDQRSSGASVPRPVRVTDQAQSRWQGNIVSSSTSQFGPAGRPGSVSTGVVIGGSRQGRGPADDARNQARAQLSERLVQSFATEAALQVLSVVDGEPAVPDPVGLSDGEK
jgi:tetratricopeptide (TPR) repeat protein